jgi:quinohemoprotein ethanol dehydrogenase
VNTCGTIRPRRERVWDYNSNMDIILADLAIDGKDTKVILHAPKNGFFYVIDRETGELISAEPFVKTTWATHIDMETGRPVEVPGARYEDSAAYVEPSPWGGHSWHAMSYNPLTGLAYLPTIHLGGIYTDEGFDLENWRAPGTGVGFYTANNTEGHPGSLQAWDPVKQQAAWSIPMETMWNAGTLTTAGNLVFQGKADGDLVAYQADDGKVLWTFKVGLGISAPPITYAVDGKQYISLLVGWGGGAAGVGGNGETQLGWAYGLHTRRLITFSLEGTKALPALPPPLVPEPIVAPDFLVDEGLAQTGGYLYGACFVCHGGGVISSGMAPDLRASAVVLNERAFKDVVKNGIRTDRAMPVHPDLTDEHLLALRHFIRKRANDTRNTPNDLMD